MIEDLGYSISWLYQNLWDRMQRPYILGGGYGFLRFTFCGLLQRAMRTSPPYGWWSPSFHLSPFTFRGVPTWVATLFHESPLTTHFSPLAYRVSETSSFL